MQVNTNMEETQRGRSGCVAVLSTIGTERGVQITRPQRVN